MNTLKISAEYRDHMGSDLTVVNAARGSFGKESTWASDGTLLKADADLIRYLALGYRKGEWEALIDDFVATVVDYEGKEMRDRISDMLRIYKNRPQHWAPFGHAHLQIRMTLPIFLGRQFVKHQVGGVWSEESRRYISEEPGVWFPSEWHNRPEDIKQGSGELIEGSIVDSIARDSTQGSIRAYRDMLEHGAAPEEARIVLPLNMMTTVVWTGSLAFWARVVNQRVDSHAQLAAQELGKLIRDIAQPLFPESFKWLISPNLQ